MATLDGVPQQGINVTWAAPGTGASVDPATTTTGPDGIATTSWTLGQVAGAQAATASSARTYPCDCAVHGASMTETVVVR